MSQALYLRLNHAVYRGWDSEVEHLLQKGYDPNLLSMQYNSSLMIAARRHHWNILDLLLQYGADPNLVNEKGEDVLSILGESPYIDRDNIPPHIIPNLLDRGARPDLHRHARLWSLLVLCGDITSVYKILSMQPQMIDSIFNYKKGVHYAVLYEKADMLQLLIRAGADPWELPGYPSYVNTSPECRKILDNFQKAYWVYRGALCHPPLIDSDHHPISYAMTRLCPDLLKELAQYVC